MTGISPAYRRFSWFPDQDDRAVLAGVRGHAVEDPRDEVAVAHHLALALDDRVVEALGQPEVALVHKRAIADGAPRARAMCHLGTERAERAECRQSRSGREPTPEERPPVERVHAEEPPLSR
jgi:hypothetical protein